MVGGKVMYTRTPQWSKDEQAMLDMMQISGAGVNVFEYYDHSCEVKVNTGDKLIAVTKDTPYEALRIAFDRWRKVKEGEP